MNKWLYARSELYRKYAGSLPDTLSQVEMITISRFTHSLVQSNSDGIKNERNLVDPLLSSQERVSL